MRDPAAPLVPTIVPPAPAALTRVNGPAAPSARLIDRPVPAGKRARHGPLAPPVPAIAPPGPDGKALRTGQHANLRPAPESPSPGNPKHNQNPLGRIPVLMRALLCLLLPPLLAAQEPASVRGLALDLRTELGADPAAGIQLAPHGCWDGLILGAAARPNHVSRRPAAGATVEVWDLASPLSPLASS